MPSSQLTQTARAALEAERGRLRRQLDELEIAEAGAEFDENFADSAQVAAEKGEQRALAGSIEEALGDVDDALAKLDDGTFGTCERCSGPIAEARLEAIPHTRFCIDCAS